MVWYNSWTLLPHEVLGVSYDATQEEIRSRYHELILLYHPDRNRSPDAASRTQAITEAYQLLSGRSADTNTKSTHIRKQAAKYHRKDPQKKGRAARKAARKAAKSKKPTREPCQTCGGRGTITTTRSILNIMKRVENKDCPDCSGSGFR